MSDVVTICNEVVEGLVRRVHLMGNEEIGADAPVDIPERAQLRRYQDELRMHHLEASWRVREPMWFDFSSWGAEKKMPVVAWAMERGEKISDAATEAALVYRVALDHWPSVAWVRRWPKGLAVEDAIVPLEEGIWMDLIDVSWAVDGFVIVGGSYNRRRP